MTRASHALPLLLLATVVLAACRSDSDAVAPETPTTGVTTTAPSPAATTQAPTTDSGSGSTTTPGTAADGGDSSTATAPPTGSSPPPTSTLVVTLPPDADELVLSDGFSDDGDGDGDGWGSDTWEVDVPGEAVVTAVDGIGVMTTDARGTHEWVRAIAADSTHDDARLDARITPVRSNEGTVFVGMRGDGEWRDNTAYLPQTGVVLEYAYSEIFEGEIVLIVLDGPDKERIGPVPGPILADGESADIRFEVVGGAARVKVWRSGTSEPSEWSLTADIPDGDSGLVQIAYRDGVDQAVAWDELTLRLWP